MGYTQPFGCFARYFVESDHGKLGCLLFSGAAKALRQRDRWIGRSESSRLRNLGQVVNNSRFVIFPWAKVKNLASHVLGQAVRRIRDEWNVMKGYHYLMQPGHRFNVMARYSEGLAKIIKDTGIRGLIRFVRDSIGSPWLDRTWIGERLTAPLQLRLV
ncbi:MAG: Druantia anti-phage system protein DruA [Syntrophobacteraceae bacterium]